LKDPEEYDLFGDKYNYDDIIWEDNRKTELDSLKCPKCQSENHEVLYSDCDSSIYWIISQCKDCRCLFGTGGSEL